MAELTAITPGADGDVAVEVVGSGEANQLAPQQLALVDAAVAHLNGILRDNGLQLALAVSDYVVNTLFGGDSTAVTSHDPTKLVTYRTLCDHPQLQMGANTLRRLVRIGLQVHALPQDVAMQLSPAQHRALLVVGDVAEKGQLARQAIENHWDADALAAAIKAGRSPQKHPRGRAAAPELVKEVNAVVKAVRQLPSAADFLAAYGQLANADKQAAYDGLFEVRAVVEGLLGQASTGSVPQ